MPRWLRGWQLALIALAVLVLMSILFGIWGFGGTWLTLGLIALVGFFATGGEPGASASTYDTEMAFGTVIGLVISGLFGFCFIFHCILEPEPRNA